VHADPVHPFFWLSHVINGNQRLARNLRAGLREIRSRQRYLQRLTDDKRLCHRAFIEGGKFLGAHIVEAPHTIPVLFSDNSMLQKEFSGLSLNKQFIGLGKRKLYRKKTQKKKHGLHGL